MYPIYPPKKRAIHLPARGSGIVSAAIIVACVFSLFTAPTIKAKRITCASFDSQEEAQAFYEKNKKKYYYLNGDPSENDLACESYFKK